MREAGVSKGYLASLNLSLLKDESELPENVEENYRRFCEAIGVDKSKLALGYQCHEDKIVELFEEDVRGREFGLDKAFEGVDGLITNARNLPLLVRFADCQGVLFFDPIKKVIAAVHSGWRGNAKNIIGKAVELMKKDFGCDAANILAGISQSLGPCCAEFTFPLIELPKFLHKYLDDKNKVDLWKCSKDQLQEAGVLPQNIEITSRCTVCENNVFFSYRGGNKKTGHMGAIIQLV